MKAEIDLNKFWNNPSIWDYFLTRQAQEELRRLVYDSIDSESMLSECEYEFYDIDEFSECLHSESTEWLKDRIGREFFNR